MRTQPAPAAHPEDPQAPAPCSAQDVFNDHATGSEHRPMKRALAHLRSNAVAYAALFVALGGTSYAALNRPAGSVGTVQLKNGAVTPAKLDPSHIAGSVRAWAQ